MICAQLAICPIQFAVWWSHAAGRSRETGVFCPAFRALWGTRRGDATQFRPFLSRDIMFQRNQMALMDGNSLKDKTRRILRRLLHPAVPKKFSLRGSKGKKKFCKSHCFSQVARVLKAQNCNEKDIEQAVSHTLQHSQDMVRLHVRNVRES